MKKTITLLAALIGLNSLAPIAASTAEIMYKDLVEPIMLSQELPVDKAWKIYDLKNRMMDQKRTLTEKVTSHHLWHDQFNNKMGATALGWMSSLFLGMGMDDLYGLYHNVFKNIPLARAHLIISVWIFAGFSAAAVFALYKDTWQIKAHKNKINEMSRFIEKLDVILEQLRKDHQKSQTSTKRFPGDPDPSYTWIGYLDGRNGNLE